MLLIGIAGSVKAKVLSNESTVTGNWAESITISAASLTNLTAGDIIAVNVTAKNDWMDGENPGTYWQYILRTAWDADEEGKGEQFNGSSAGVDAVGTYYYALTAENVAAIKKFGLNVTGKYVTFDKVEVLYKKVLWSGSLVGSTDWEQSDALEASLFTSLKEGSVIGFTISAINDGDWHSFLLRYNYADNIVDRGVSETGTYLHTLTSEDVTKLQDENAVNLVARYLTIAELSTYTALPATITLSETAFPTFAAGTYETVNLTRTLLAGYNTIILPFATTAEELAGTGAYAATIKTTNEANDVLTFVKVDNMEANKPYLIYVPADVADPSLSDKTLMDIPENYWDYQSWDYGAVNGQRWYLQGNYMPSKDVSGDGIYVVSGENSISPTTTGATLNGLRAYLVNTTSGDVKQNLNFVVEDSTTGISQSVKMEQHDGAVYNLAGQRVAKAIRGIYIVNGKKIVMK